MTRSGKGCWLLALGTREVARSAGTRTRRSPGLVHGRSPAGSLSQAPQTDDCSPSCRRRNFTCTGAHPACGLGSHPKSRGRAQRGVGRGHSRSSQLAPKAQEVLGSPGLRRFVLRPASIHPESCQMHAPHAPAGWVSVLGGRVVGSGPACPEATGSHTVTAAPARRPQSLRGPGAPLRTTCW